MPKRDAPRSVTPQLEKIYTAQYRHCSSLPYLEPNAIHQLEAIPLPSFSPPRAANSRSSSIDIPSLKELISGHPFGYRIFAPDRPPPNASQERAAPLRRPRIEDNNNPRTQPRVVEVCATPFFTDQTTSSVCNTSFQNVRDRLTRHLRNADRLARYLST